MNKFVVTYGLREKNIERQKGEMKKEQIRECEMSGRQVSNADFEERIQENQQWDEVADKE